MPLVVGWIVLYVLDSFDNVLVSAVLATSLNPKIPNFFYLGEVFSIRHGFLDIEQAELVMALGTFGPLRQFNWPPSQQDR